MHAIALVVGLVVSLSTSSGWAMDPDQFLKISPAAQSAYVAGVVDTLQSRRILEILDKNANVSRSALEKTPFLRCLSETSYGTFRSATLDLLRVGPKDDGVAAWVVVRAVQRLCPPEW